MCSGHFFLPGNRASPRKTQGRAPRCAINPWLTSSAVISDQVEQIVAPKETQRDQMKSTLLAYNFARHKTCAVHGIQGAVLGFHVVLEHISVEAPRPSVKAERFVLRSNARKEGVRQEYSRGAHTQQVARVTGGSGRELRPRAEQYGNRRSLSFYNHITATRRQQA